MKAGEKTTVSRRLPVWRFWGLALVVAFVIGTLWVSPVQAETDTGGSCITIKVYKFEDKDGDGTKDSNENYLSGWTFTLTKPDNTTVSGTTGSGGYKTFTISSCTYGTYTLTETLQSGWYNTTGGLSQTQEITENNKSWTAYFGNAKYSAIKVRKFEDKNGNGNKDSGEGWLNGWTFTLSDSGGNPIGSGSTSGSGSLTFGNLVSGTYTVTETLQNGYLSTTGLNQSVSLGNAETKEVKFGNAKLAEICIYKFEDSDGDGTKDATESYLSGWTFKLYDEQNNLVGEATTQDHGGTIKASFWVFVPGNQSKTFKAVEVPQPGYYPTTPTEQTTTSVSYGGWAELFFGNAPYGEIKVYKFEDLDGDGTWDNNEPPLPDWKFELSQSQVITSGVTGQDGSLVFGNLKAGSYTVTEVLSADYQPTTPNPQSTNVAPGQQATLTFGNQRYDMDYGDLPKEYGLTLFANNGARHKPILCLASEEACDSWLGEVRDHEYNGIEHEAAFGDDPTNNDEDGVVRGPSWGGGTGVISVTVSGAPGCLTGWVDYFDKGDGELGVDYQFSESFTYNSNTYTEKVIDNLLLTLGTHTVTFSLPPDFANTSVFARFRLVPALWNGESYHCDRAAVELDSLEIGGEVEDYYWQFGPTAVNLKKVSAVPQQSTAGFGLVAAGLVVSLTALLIGRRRRK